MSKHHGMDANFDYELVLDGSSTYALIYKYVIYRYLKKNLIAVFEFCKLGVIYNW